MKNRLISEEQREEGKNWDPKGWNEHNRSGKTTGIALVAIGTAMRDPGKEVILLDHYTGLDQFNGSLLVSNVVADLVSSMGLKFLKVSEGRHGNERCFFLTYNVFE